MTSVAVRPAATLLLVRDNSGIEVLMLARRLDSVFAAGAHVFPGGAVDPGDGGESIARRCLPLDDIQASRLLGVDVGGLDYWVAAVRETYEEVGVLLVARADGAPIPPTELRHERWRKARAQVDDGSLPFAELADRENLLLGATHMRPLGHWITPVGAPRRYDTRFFLAEAPDGQVPSPDHKEAVSVRWVRPEVALDEHYGDEIDLILPTERALSVLARFDDVKRLLAAVDEGVARGDHVADHGGWRIALPGDQTGSIRPGSDPPALRADG